MIKNIINDLKKINFLTTYNWFLIILSILVIFLTSTILSYIDSTTQDSVYASASEEIEIITRPIINWDSDLNTTDMLLPNKNSKPRHTPPTHIVLHFISNAYNNQKNPYEINDIYSILKEYELSSHYVIGRDGEIYLFTPENRVAYHAGSGELSNYPKYENKLNNYSIGIEILAMGTKEEMIPIITAERFNLIDPSLLGYTDPQYESLNLLIDDILNRHVFIQKDREHIIGHDEYNPEKTDPGSLFDWSKIISTPEVQKIGN
ncbi:hypothetical protein SDC9_57058 [bioreactor metagenome]|uniref:N-acetylmuramoyl-L-alanine amidase n=1 Tax=bioreactor metagenome TaxID=1076179 RepID=A0A644X9B2_9ZZZZ